MEVVSSEYRVKTVLSRLERIIDNENERIEQILEIAGEDDVLVVSDAGMRSAKIVGGEDACTQDVWSTDTL